MRKKVLSWLLTVSMVVSLIISVPITASADGSAAGNGAAFNSSGNSFIQVSDSCSLDVVNALTVEAWIKPSSGGGEWALIMGKQWNPADANPWYSYRLLAASADSDEKGFPRKVAFQIAPEGSLETGVESTTIVQNDVWTHVAGVYDGSTVKIYINGVLEGSNPVTGSIRTSSHPLYFGKAPLTNNNNYNGMMDEVRVWNVARTAEQISDDMQYVLAGDETGLVGYWNFNEALGQTIVADASGNSNTGTLYEGSLAASNAPVSTPSASYWTNYAASAFDGGDGSSGNPYQIATEGQLAYLASLAVSDNAVTTGKYYQLTADLDLSAHYWTPIAFFKGHFDGGNHTISGLTIDSTADYQGLFGQCDGAELKNILISCSITTTGSAAAGLSGGVNNVAVTNCHIAGNVSGLSYCGGLIGYINSQYGGSNSITDSSSSCSITANSSGDAQTGGLIGMSYGGTTTITRCCATGDVSGYSNVGGILGLAYQVGGYVYVTDSYSTGNVYASKSSQGYNAGGLLGMAQNHNIVVTNFYQSGTVSCPNSPVANNAQLGGILGCDGGHYASFNYTNVYYNAANPTGDTTPSGTATPLSIAATGGTLDMLDTSGADGSNDFVATLNNSGNVWVADPGTLNDGFPMLAWQVTPATYTVSIGMLSGGTITANPTSAISGTTINLTVTPDSGKQLKAGTLKYNDGSDHAVTGTSFTMPAANVTVTAEFENVPITGLAEDFDTHGLSGWAVADVNGTNGDWTISNTRANSGAYSAKFNSYSVSVGTSARLYQTSDLSIPSGQALSFWMYHSTDWPTGNDTVSAQISTDGGSTWQTLGTYSRVNGTNAWEKIELDLSSYTGQTVRFGFLGLSAYGEHLYIDDISLSESVTAAPTLQSAATSADGTKVILTFNKAMADPAGKEAQFAVTAGGSGNTVTAAALGTDTKTIELTLTMPVTYGQTVTASYTAGTVTASDVGVLASFTNQSVTNNVPANVAQIGSTGYATLAGALTAAAGTDTILLLSDITYSNAIKADAKNVTIDLNGFDLTVSGVGGHALYAANAYTLTITDQDKDGGSLSVSSSGAYKFAAAAATGGNIIIEGTLTAAYPGGDTQEIIGAFATGNDSTIQVTGNVTGYSAGIYAISGAEILVIGDVSGSYYGAYAAYNGSVNVTGNVTGSYALVAEYAGIAEVEGTVTGGAAGIYTNNTNGWAAPSVTLTGDVTATGGTAINASQAGDIGITGDVNGSVSVAGVDISCPEITVNGDVTVSGGHGIDVFYGGTVTVNGRILGTSTGQYLKLNNLYVAQDAYVIDGSYNKYSNQTVDTPAPFAANTVYVAIPPSHTVTIGTLSGGTITANPATAVSGTTINLTVTPDSGKQLKAGTLKYNDGSDHAITGTSFTMPAANVTVTAQFENIPASGGGGGGSGTVPVAGTKVTVSTTDGSSSVEGTLTQSNGGTQVVIKNDAFDKVDAANKPVSVSAQLATVTFDTKAMDTIGTASGTGDVTLTVRKVGVSELTAAQKALVGSRPVYDFTVTGGSGTISSFGGGYATVSIPYTLQAGENPYAIVVWYLSDSGKLVGTRGCYNAATGTVTFMTPHFSSFVIGYNPVSFNDVSTGDWHHDAVSFIAARGITTGTGGGNFSPSATLTRGQFIVMLLRAYGIEPDVNPTANFSDAGSTYYTGYLAAAKRLGISAGVGNNMFAPEQAITRQEMFTLLYNALGAIGELPTGSSGKKLSDFTDADRIASWSKDAMTLLVETGTISGSGGKLNPTDTTTRAEMAQVLYNLLTVE